MDTNYLFVYGLLKSTFENEAAQLVRTHCELIGEGSFPGYLYNLGEYPGVIYDESSPYIVHGEVFKIDTEKEKLIQFLDEFEGLGEQVEQPNEYRKEIIPVKTEKGTLQARCYIYNLEPDGFTLIESGRYDCN